MPCLFHVQLVADVAVGAAAVAAAGIQSQIHSPMNHVYCARDVLDARSAVVPKLRSKIRPTTIAFGDHTVGIRSSLKH